MVLNEEHLREVIHSDTVDETSVRGRQQLQTIGRSTKTVHSAKQLGAGQHLRLIVIDAEKDDLTVTAANNDLISSHGFDRLNTFGTSVDIEGEGLVLDLESEKITGLGAREEHVLTVLAESHAGVVAHNGTRVDQVVGSLTSGRVQLPEGHLALTRNRELIVRGVATLVIFGVAAPGQALRRLAERRGNDGERAHNVAVRSIPDEELAVESVAA